MRLGIIIILFSLLGVSCSKDCSLSSCLPIIPNSEEVEVTGRSDYDERTNGETYLLKHFLKPNYTVFDVGANVGRWSKHALAIQPSLKLTAFEPIPEVFARLKRELGKTSSVHNLAVSDRIGRTNFFFYNENWFTTKLSGFYKRPIKHKKMLLKPIMIKVEQDTLDHFCFNQDITNIDLLKIDAEGAELKILYGAESLIRNQQIRAIQFEYDRSYEHAGTTLKEVMKYLTGRSYVLFRVTPQGLIHVDAWREQMEDLRHTNYFAVRKPDVPDYKLIENFDRVNLTAK